MIQRLWGWSLIPAILGHFFLYGCDTYTYLPTRTKVVSPSPTGADEQAAPPEAAAPPAPSVPTIEQRLRDMESRLVGLENRLSQLEAVKSGPPSRPTGRAEKKPLGKNAGVPPGYPPPSEAQEKVYQEGKRLYDAKKYAAAREKFSHYLRVQPKGSKSAEARYHLADSFYQEKHYQEAAVEFNKLVTQHPKHLYAPAALLRQAYCYDQLKRKGAYRSTLKKLMESYPQSPEAKEAEKELKGQEKRSEQKP